MNLYKYDKNTKEYKGVLPALIDPEASKKSGKKVYAYPPYTTVVEPEHEEGKVPVFNGENWDLVSDYRGRIVYRKDSQKPFVIVTLGELSEDLTFEKPSKIAILRRKLKQLINRK